MSRVDDLLYSRNPIHVARPEDWEKIRRMQKIGRWTGQGSRLARAGNKRFFIEHEEDGWNLKETQDAFSLGTTVAVFDTLEDAIDAYDAGYKRNPLRPATGIAGPGRAEHVAEMKRMAKEWWDEVAWRQAFGGNVKEALDNARCYDANAYTAEQLPRHNPRGPQTAAWLTQFWKAWENLNGVGRHQLEISDQRRLQAQADSLYRVGFTAKRAAWMASERHGMPIGRMPNPDSSWHQARMEQWDRALPHSGYNNRLVRGRLSEAQDSYIESRKREGPKANPGIDLAQLRKIKGFQDWMIDHPDFKRGIEKYVEFHGVLPTKISQKDMPGVVPKGKAAFFVGMGKGVEETYLPTDKRSSKHGSAYIHKYADNKGKSATEKDLPDKICSVDGKTILTVGGKFKVSDWIRG